MIQGSTGGIGLALVRQYLVQYPEATVIATSRLRGEGPEELQLLKDSYQQRLQIIQLDVECEKSVKNASMRVQELVDQLDGIVNVSGILHEENMTPEKRLSDVVPEHFEKVLRTNALGPLLVAKWFSSLLSKQIPTYFVNISAKVGSITDNRLGGWYSYRSSKAALNMITRNLAIELKRNRPKVVCVALHPGTTDTVLSKPFQRNVPRTKLSTPTETAVRILKVLDELNLHHNGSFLSAEGLLIPW